jgi:cell division protein FtsI/penicillin-binding protein 2
MADQQTGAGRPRDVEPHDEWAANSDYSDEPTGSTPAYDDDQPEEWEGSGRGRTAAIVLAILVVVLAAGGLGAFLAFGGHKTSARPEAAAYLAAWGRGDTAAMAAVVDSPPADFATQIKAFDGALHATGSRFDLVRMRSVHGGQVADFHAHFDVAGFGPWEYDGNLPLSKVAGHWRVQFSSTALHPALAPGLHLAIERTWASRAPILGVDGTPLVAGQDTVTVGLNPSHITNLDQVKAALSSTLHIPGTAVDQALNGPGVRQRNLFAPVATVPKDGQYTGLHSQLAPIPGIAFMGAGSLRVPIPGLNGSVVGTVGDITADRLKQLGGPYRVGDKVGLTGLESTFQTRLAGSPKGDIDVLDAGNALVRTLQEFPGVPPQPVHTTIDVTVQRAAQSALAGISQPAAIVAIDARTGALRAVANDPVGGYDRALAGVYPPGSTFKVVTSAALLASGANLNSPTACTPTVTISGRQFKNIEGEIPGTIPLHHAFAVSCNTSFVSFSHSTLAPNALTEAAARFGFGIAPHLGVTAVSGSVPTPTDPADAAAEAIGQGRITASPLQMATVAATVDAGTWHAPSLVTDPLPSSGTAGTAATTTPGGPVPATPPPLDPTVAAGLRSMMAEVVSSRMGTGTAAALPGTPVSGKTGTAEYGTGPTLPTRAWFIGFRGNLAFAVLDESGVGGKVAAPIAATFLRATPVS